MSAAKYAVAAGEMTEEYLQEILTPVFRNLALGENNEFKLFTEDAAYAALLAALSVGALEGPRIVSTDISMNKAGRTTENAVGSAQELRTGGVDIPTAQNPVEGAKNAPVDGAQKRASDRDAYTVIQKLGENISTLNKDAPVARVSSAAVENIGGRTMAEKARALFSYIKGVVNRAGFGEVEINDRSVKDDLSHGVGVAKAMVIPSIPEVIRKGRQIDFQENWKGRGYDGYVFAAPVKLDKETVFVAAVVKRTSKNRFYLHEVVDSRGNIIKMSSRESATQTSLAADGDAGTQSPLPIDIIPQTPLEVNLQTTAPTGKVSDLEVLRELALEMARESIRRGDLGPVPEIPPRPVQLSTQEILSRLAWEMAMDPQTREIPPRPVQPSAQEILSRLAREMTQDPGDSLPSLSDEDLRAMLDKIAQKMDNEHEMDFTMSASDGILSEQDVYAIDQYKKSSVSYPLNAILRGEAPMTEEFKAITHDIDQALLKLPTYQGTVYRSLTSSMIGDMDAFKGKYVPGAVVIEHAFTSSSADGVYDASMDIQMIIKSKRGCDMRPYNPLEQEVLFRRGSIFMVEKVEGNTIWLTEV